MKVRLPIVVGDSPPMLAGFMELDRIPPGRLLQIPFLGPAEFIGDIDVRSYSPVVAACFSTDSLHSGTVSLPAYRPANGEAMDVLQEVRRGPCHVVRPMVSLEPLPPAPDRITAAEYAHALDRARVVADLFGQRLTARYFSGGEQALETQLVRDLPPERSVNSGSFNTAALLNMVEQLAPARLDYSVFDALRWAEDRIRQAFLNVNGEVLPSPIAGSNRGRIDLRFELLRPPSTYGSEPLASDEAAAAAAQVRRQRARPLRDFLRDVEEITRPPVSRMHSRELAVHGARARDPEEDDEPLAPPPDFLPPLD